MNEPDTTHAAMELDHLITPEQRLRLAMGLQ